MQLDIDPYADGAQPTGPTFTKTKETLRKCAEFLPANAPQIISMEKDSIPFGLGLDSLDVQDWLLLNQSNNQWAQATWERGSFYETAVFTTKSLSDACNFFIALRRFWPDINTILQMSESNRAHIYADACKSDLDLRKMVMDIKQAFVAVETRFQEHRLPVHFDGDRALVAPTLRLFSHEDIFCLENQNGQNQCWFGHFGDALTAMLSILTKTSIVKPDEHSLFPWLDAGSTR